VSEPLARLLLDEVERARMGRGEARGRERRRAREECARDAIVSGDVVSSIGESGLMATWYEGLEVWRAGSIDFQCVAMIG